MAEGSAVANKPDRPVAPGSSMSRVEVLFDRRIEFHLARKPCSSFSSADGDFRLETLNPSSGPARPAAISGGAPPAGAPSPGKRSGEGQFYEHGLDPELSFRITFRRIGAGLANLGNTCFLNSVLQCLTYTEPFAAYLQSGKHKSSCHTAGFCAMCALQNHVITALQSSGKILSPSHLVKNLRCISHNFRTSRQEDAHEYMVNLLETMHKCCLPSGVPSESPSAYEKSLVHKIFGGRLRSQVKCMQCSYSSSKFDPFVDLSLEIVKADSLRKALTHFTAVEHLDGGERQYQCQHCKEKVRALKQLTIHKAPYVLTIHLKRFSSYVPGQKIDKKVDFEPTLDLKPFLSDQHGGDVKYTLYGVLVHAGWSTHSGHYYCYVRTSSGMWHSLDDNQVRQVSEKTVLAQKAYMLFYVRDRSSMPKGSVNMVRKDNISVNASGKKLIHDSSLVSNQAVQNSVLQTKLSTSESISKFGTCNTNIQSGSAMGPSLHNPSPQTLSTLQKKDNTVSNEVSRLKNNSQVIEREITTLQADGDLLPEGLQKTTSTSVALLKNPIMPAVGTVLPEVKKDLLVEKAISKATCENYAPRSDQFDSERYHVSGGSKGEVKSGVLAQPNNPGCPGPKSHKHENRLLKESDMAKNHEKTVNNIPEEHGKTRLLSQASHMNGFIMKEANDKAPMGNLSRHHKEGCSSSLQSHAENLPKREKPSLVDLSKSLGSANSCVQKEAPEGYGTTDISTELKPKKLTKCLQKDLRFGRNHLFLASLSLHKIKKAKKNKKRHSSSKNLLTDVLDGIKLNDQGASTLAAIKNAAIGKHFRLQCSRFGLIEDSNTQKVKSGNYCNGEALNNTADRGEVNNTRKNTTLVNSELPRSCLSSAEKMLNSRATYADDRGSLQHDFMNLLMGDLKEATVPRWDDVELPKLGGLQSSIGYVLDEWDEEYDRGKRKKLRKSQSLFGGPNPFQETANVKAQQKKFKSKLEQTRLGNQPFRI